MSAEVHWDDLRCLDALVREKTVGAAARQLGISSSTLYRRIAALEAATGTRCLVRGTGPTELTEAGKILAGAAQRTREAILRVVGEVKSDDARLAGEVSLTTVEGMMPFLGAPLAELAELNPDLRIRLHLSDTGPSVRRREVDVAIGVMERPPADCWGRRLFRIRYGVFGTEEATRRDPLRWVVLGPPMDRVPEGQWEAAHAEHVALATASRGGIVTLVRAGAGVGLLPRPLASLHPELVELRRYRSSLETLERVAWILTHESARKTPRIAAVAQVLVKHLSKLA